MNNPTKKNTGLAEAGQDLGKRVLHEFAGLKVTVEIIDVKYAYGKKRWKVRVADQASSNDIWIDVPKV